MNRLLFLVACLAACKSDKPAAETPPAPPAPAETAPTATPPAPPASPTPVVDGSKYDRACKVATDCVIAKAASCDPCACPSEPIASKELAKFDEAAAALDCKPDLEFKCTAPCPTRLAACTDGTCVIAP